MPDRLLTRSEDSMLQVEMSAVTEGSVMGVSAEVEVDTELAIHWWLLLRKKKCLSSDISVQNAENHMWTKGTWSALRKQHHKLDDGPCFPCSQCHKKVTMSDDLHSHTNSVHLKIKPFKCETCKRLFAHNRSLEPGRYSCTVNAQDVCGHCGKVFKSRGSLEDHAKSHDGSLPYPCNKCLVRFRYRNQLKWLCWLRHCHSVFVLVQSEHSYVKPRWDNRNRSIWSSCNKVA